MSIHVNDRGAFSSGARLGAFQPDVRAAFRAVPPGSQIALLPNAGLPARSRGPRAGDLVARLAELRQLRGRLVSRLALPDRDQCLPQCAREAQARGALAAGPAGTRLADDAAWRPGYRRGMAPA